MIAVGGSFSETVNLMRHLRPAAMLAFCLSLAASARGVDVSLPATLQYFESTYAS